MVENLWKSDILSKDAGWWPALYLKCHSSTGVLVSSAWKSKIQMASSKISLMLRRKGFGPQVEISIISSTKYFILRIFHPE